MKQIKYIFYYLIVLIFVSCANVQPPTGGPPDKTPPEIIQYYPEMGTKNFSGSYIRLEFNKWMNRNAVLENIYISPDVELSYDWSGEELEIEFEEELDSNTTYVLNLGTDYTDYKQNKPEEAFTLIFSTGNYLDSGAITGNLVDKNTSGAFIYAYKIDDINSDTLNPGHSKPNYRTQVGTTGKFELLALKPGTYRLFAMRDVYKDNIYDEGVDDFGAAPMDVEVKEDIIPEVDLKIGPPVDVIGPQLFSAEAYFYDLVTLSFSEPIDPKSIINESIILSDSLETKFVNIVGVMISNESPENLFLIPEIGLDTNTLWKINLLTGDDVSVKDSCGNSINDTLNLAYFFSSVDKDTSKIQLKSFPFKDSSSNISINPELKFQFERPLINEDLNTRVKAYDSDSSELTLIISQLNSSIISVKNKDILIPNSWYRLEFVLDSLCYHNGSCFNDSTLILNFRTLDSRTFGAAKGKIKGLSSADSTLKIIFKNDQNTFITSPQDSGKWSIENMPSGKYEIELYYDLDNNDQYSFGSSFQFRHSEPFIKLKEEKDIPSRWTVEMVLPKPER